MSTETGVGSRSGAMGDPRMALPHELREALDREIDPGESLRWCGQPDPRRIWIRVLPPFMFFGALGALLGGVSVYAAIAELAKVRAGVADASLTALIGACGLTVFMLATSTAMCWQPWVEKAKALRTVFALTNTRVFILVLLKDGRANMTALEPVHPLAISRVEHRGGTATVLLNPGTQVQGGGQAPRASLLLVGVREPRAVERLIRQTFDPPGVR